MIFRPQKLPCTRANGSCGTNSDGLENNLSRAVCEGPEELPFWRDLEQVLDQVFGRGVCVIVCKFIVANYHAGVGGRTRSDVVFGCGVKAVLKELSAYAVPLRCAMDGTLLEIKID